MSDKNHVTETPPRSCDAGFDPLVANPGRLQILTALAAPEEREQAETASAGEPGLDFVDLRRQTRLTDGNLACHAKRLEAGGLIRVGKQFRAGKPVTTFVLTEAGRDALEAHVRQLLSVLRRPPMREVEATDAPEPEMVAMPTSNGGQHDAEDDWID